MAVLTRFDTPGRIAELPDSARDAWSGTVARMVRRFVPTFPQFYDPTAEDTPDGLAPVDIAWGAFPARVLRAEGPGTPRWARADGSRDQQDEYCEWSVERDAGGKVTRITFTTEVPEYWDHVARHDEDMLLALYHEHVDPRARSTTSSKAASTSGATGGTPRPRAGWRIWCRGATPSSPPSSSWPRRRSCASALTGTP